MVPCQTVDLEVCDFLKLTAAMLLPEHDARSLCLDVAQFLGKNGLQIKMKETSQQAHGVIMMSDRRRSDVDMTS